VWPTRTSRLCCGRATHDVHDVTPRRIRELPTDVTQMLRRWREGDPEAMDRVLPVVYEELRQLARARLRGERAGHTLGTTGLVHEAYLRLVDVERVEWQDRAHFLAMASRTMRRVLIDYANQRNAAKRGGARQQLSLDEKLAAPEVDLDTVLELDDALSWLRSARGKRRRSSSASSAASRSRRQPRCSAPPRRRRCGTCDSRRHGWHGS